MSLICYYLIAEFWLLYISVTVLASRISSVVLVNPCLYQHSFSADHINEMPILCWAHTSCFNICLETPIQHELTLCSLASVLQKYVQLRDVFVWSQKGPKSVYNQWLINDISSIFGWKKSTFVCIFFLWIFSSIFLIWAKESATPYNFLLHRPNVKNLYLLKLAAVLVSINTALQHTQKY